MMPAKISKEVDTKNREFLKAIRAFFIFPPEDEKLLAESLNWRTFKKGYTLDSRNEMMHNVYYLSHGVARTFYIEKGKEFNYAFSFGGQFLVKPQSIMYKDKRHIFVQFLKDTEVCYFPNESFESVEKTNAMEFQRLINIGLLHALEDVEEQLLMLRMEAKERYRWALERYPHILEEVSVSQLALFLNVTKETLYRIRSGKY